MSRSQRRQTGALASNWLVAIVLLLAVSALGPSVAQARGRFCGSLAGTEYTTATAEVERGTVSCAVARTVGHRLLVEPKRWGYYHFGTDNANSWWVIDGHWQCFGPHTGSWSCSYGHQRVGGTARE